MRVRITILFLILAMLAGGVPAVAAPPDGTLTIGVHVTLVNRWLDPAETEGLITPFMVLYPLHDALVKPMPAGINTPEPRRVVDRCRRTGSPTTSCCARTPSSTTATPSPRRT